MKEYRFTAKLEDAGNGGVYVRFPHNAKKEFGKGRVPMRCTIDGEPYRGTLIKYGTPFHIIPVLNAIRGKINKKPGDNVKIWLAEDMQERKIAAPAGFEELLRKNKISDAFARLSFSHQRAYVTWIESAGKPETRAARMQKAILLVTEKQKKVQPK